MIIKNLSRNRFEKFKINIFDDYLQFFINTI